MFSSSANSNAVFQRVNKIKETVRSVNAEQCHGPHNKYDLSMTALKEVFSKQLLSCGLWTPSSMDFVWDVWMPEYRVHKYLKIVFKEELLIFPDDLHRM